MSTHYGVTACTSQIRIQRRTITRKKGRTNAQTRGSADAQTSKQNSKGYIELSANGIDTKHPMFHFYV